MTKQLASILILGLLTPPFIFGYSFHIYRFDKTPKSTEMAVVSISLGLVKGGSWEYNGSTTVVWVHPDLKNPYKN